MTHEEIEQREIVDAYVSGSLTDDDRSTFEEHFFGCDRCFADVQSAERLRQGVRDAVEAGRFDSPGREAWLRPAFALSAAAAVILASATAWTMGYQAPRLRNETRRLQEQAVALQAQIAQHEMAMARPPAPAAANLPLVMLEASRAESAGILTIPAGATHVALWIEVGLSKHRSFRLELAGASAPLILEGLEKNSYGAVAAVAPAEKLPSGSYRARLFGKTGLRSVLVAEYELEVRR